MPTLARDTLQRFQNLVLSDAETLNVEHVILRLVLFLQHPHHSRGDGLDRRRRPLDLSTVEDGRLDVELQKPGFQTVVEEMATDQTRPGQAARRLAAARGQLLRPVEQHELQSACTARVTAAKVRGNEALDACSGGGASARRICRSLFDPAKTTTMASWPRSTCTSSSSGKSSDTRATWTEGGYVDLDDVRERTVTVKVPAEKEGVEDGRAEFAVGADEGYFFDCHVCYCNEL